MAESFEAACHILLAKNVSKRNVDELSAFLTTHRKELSLAPGAGDKANEVYRIRLLTALVTLYKSDTCDDERLAVASKHVPYFAQNDQFFVDVFMFIGETAKHFVGSHKDDRKYELNDSLLPELFKLVYQSLLTVIPNSSNLIVDWFELALGPSKFFASLSPQNRAMGLIITAQFIDIHQDFRLENQNHSYFKDSKAMAAIHTVVSSDLDEVDPEYLLLWGLVLHNVALRYIESPSKGMVGFLSVVGVKDGDSLDYAAKDLLTTALDSFALGKLVEAVKLLPTNVQYAQTASDVLSALIAITRISAPIAAAAATLLENFPVLAREFFVDPHASTALEIVKAKVPAALPAFVLLARAFPDAYSLLSNMTSFIDTINDKNVLNIQASDVLTMKDLTIFPPRPTDWQGAITLPSQTPGKLLGNSGESGALVMFNFQYNGWSFLGRVLENAYLSNNWQEDSNNIVRLITSALTPLDEDEADGFLGALSAGLARGDIIDLLSDVFESAMSSFTNLTTCIVMINFLQKLALTLPQRVWTQLARSRLLEQRGDTGFMSSVVAAVEIFSNRFDFTLTIIDLVKVLLNQFDSKNPLQEETLAKLLRHVMDVFESFEYWAYNDDTQRQNILLGIIGIFDLTLKVPGEQMPKFIFEELLSSSASHKRTIRPLLSPISASTQLANVDDLLLRTVLEFCSSLIKVRSTRKLPYSLLERELYVYCPELVVIYASHTSLHGPILSILTALVGAEVQEQPSLLAHLGKDKSNLLLKSLIQTIENDLELDDTVFLLSDFLGAVSSSKQEGLLVLLMSGQDPRDQCSGKVGSLFSSLQKKFVDCHDKLSPKALAAIVHSLALSYTTTRKEPAELSDSLGEALISLIKNGRNIKHSDNADVCFSIYAVAKAVHILSDRLFQSSSSNTQPTGAIKSFIDFLSSPPNLTDYSTQFLSLEGFDTELHSSLHTAFVSKGKLPTSLASEQQNILSSAYSNLPTYGEEFVYNLSELDVTLKNDAQWTSKLRADAWKANLNLSYVHAQNTLLFHWQSWCLTLASFETSRLAPQLESLALLALRSNSKRDLAIPYLDKSVQMRVELVFFILYQLKRSGNISPSIDIINSTLEFAADSSVGITAGVSGSNTTNVYKHFLKIINLELEVFANKPEQASKHTQTLLSLLDAIAIRAVRVIAVEAPSRPESTAEDLVEVISILRHILNIIGRSSSQLHSLSQIMIDSGTDRAVARLYSYALDINPKNPVLGELALLYILEWLPVGFMADNFISNGLLTVLLESPMSRQIQQGNIVVSAEPRLHESWRHGLLMILLLIIQQLGARIIPEAILFIESFSPQIQTCLDQWTSSNGEISIALIEETFLLNVLLTLLSSYEHRSTDLSKILQKDDLLQAIDHLSSHRKYLSTRLLATPGKSTDEAVDKVIAEMTELRIIVEQRL